MTANVLKYMDPHRVNGGEEGIRTLETVPDLHP